MSDTYEATFTWPAGPNEVIITGSFDNWSKSTKLIRSWEGSFSTTLKFPWGSRILFKYIVDGQWVTSRHEKTETDPNGNVNNVFQVPPKPEPTPTPVPPPVPATVETETVPTPAPSQPQPQPATDTSVKDSVVKTLTSVKDSALATEGVQPPSVTSYVASGVGAAIASVTGVDPINAPKIPVHEPETKPTAETELDLSPAAEHGKSPASSNGSALHETLPSLLPAAADGKETASSQPAEGLPSLLPAASERKSEVSPTAPTTTETAPPPEPAATAAIPEPTPTIPEPPVTAETAPPPEPEAPAPPAEPTPIPNEEAAQAPVPVSEPIPTPTTAAKVPEPISTQAETKPATHVPEPSEAASTLKEKVVYGADELGRNVSSTPGSTVKTKKKRTSIFGKLKAVFNPEKEKEKLKK